MRTWTSWRRATGTHSGSSHSHAMSATTEAVSTSGSMSGSGGAPPLEPLARVLPARASTLPWTTRTLGLEQEPDLLEDAREQHDVDRARQVFERRVRHDLALARHHATHLSHQAGHTHLRLLKRARHLDGLGVGELGELG